MHASIALALMLSTVGGAASFEAAPAPAPPSQPPPLPWFVVQAVPDLSPGAPGFQVVIEERVIIRVPARRMPLNSFATQQVTVTERRAPPPMVWREVKGPKCLPMRSVLGVQAATRDSIDIITRERQRLRAQLNRGCRGLDFYSGFYMQGTRDGRLCADRDPIHARSGMQCEINRFRLLVPEGARD